MIRVHAQTDLRSHVDALMRATASMLLAALLLLAVAASALADFGIIPPGQPGGFEADVVDTQAGGHSDAYTVFNFNTTPQGLDGGQFRNVTVDLPPGLIGNPEAVAACTQEQLMNVNGPQCASASQVGTADVQIDFGGTQIPWGTFPVFNMQASRDKLANLSFVVLGVPVRIDISLRPGDYGLRTVVRNAPEFLSISGTTLRVWAVPADPANDMMRHPCIGTGEACPSSAPRRPFFTNPTVCDEPKTTTITVDSWNEPGVVRSWSTRTATAPSGCDRLSFEPTLRITQDTTNAGSPSGYRVELGVPQNDDPDGLATAHLKDAVVTMPPGVTLAPGTADGLAACTDEAFGAGSNDEPTCSQASRIGTVEIHTPVLPESLTGEVFVGRQLPDDPYRIFFAARAPGVLVKLKGSVHADPVTGQLTATFSDNPQLPFDRLILDFKGGPRAPLANPDVCGQAAATSRLTSWGGQVATPSASIQTTGCAGRGFSPSFSAGMANPAAGTPSAFSLTFGRDDDDDILRDITVQMPAGLTGVIAQADVCGDQPAGAGTCSEGSRIGSTTTGAGPGANPFFLPGRVYLTGPYKGAPFGLSIVVPAVAGPFDLGVVVVRAAIFVDRQTTALRVVSDPLPSILLGVPLRVRTVNVSIDRPGFMLSPTNCGRRSVDGRISSGAGSAASVRSPFQVGSCRSLPYAPRMSMRIGDRRHVRAESTAPLTVTLTMPRAPQANNKSVAVTLPTNVNSRLSALRGACSVAAASARRCGPGAIVGRATAITPLLRDAVTGPVYITRTPGNRLPNLLVALRGRGVASMVDIDLIGRVRVLPGTLQLRTTFGEIPDVPVTKFTLRFVAGAQAPIGLVRGVCSARVQRAMQAGLLLRAQSGRVVARKQKLQINGCASRRSRGASRATNPRRTTGRRSMSTRAAALER